MTREELFRQVDEGLKGRRMTDQVWLLGVAVILRTVTRQDAARLAELGVDTSKEEVPAVKTRAIEKGELKHNLAGNCFHRKRTDVCKLHDEPRGNCDVCPPCPACRKRETGHGN